MSGIADSSETLTSLKAVVAQAWNAARPSRGGIPRTSRRALSPTIAARAATLPVVSAVIQRCHMSPMAARTAAESTAGAVAAVSSAFLAQAPRAAARARSEYQRRADMRASGRNGVRPLEKWGAIDYAPGRERARSTLRGERSTHHSGGFGGSAGSLPPPPVQNF